jgi:hypothetical protein
MFFLKPGATSDAETAGSFKPIRQELWSPGSPDRPRTTARPTTMAPRASPHGEAADCSRTFATRPTHEPLSFRSSPVQTPGRGPSKRKGVRRGSTASLLYRFSPAILAGGSRKSTGSTTWGIAVAAPQRPRPRRTSKTLPTPRWAVAALAAASTAVRSGVLHHPFGPASGDPCHGVRRQPVASMTSSAFATSGSARSTREPCCRTLAP